MSSDKVPAPFPNPNNTSSKKRRWVEDSPSQFSNNAAPSQPKPKSESSMASVMSGANSKSSKKYKDDGEMSGGDQWGKKSDQPPSKKDSGPKELANFGVSGALAKDESTGNIYNGVQLKFSEPADARTPSTKWRLYVFKEGGGTIQSRPSTFQSRVRICLGERSVLQIYSWNTAACQSSTVCCSIEQRWTRRTGRQSASLI